MINKIEIVNGHYVKKINKWFDACESKGDYPFIYVKNHKKYCEITFDFITLNKENKTKLEVFEYNFFVFLCKKIFFKYAIKKPVSNYSISKHIVIFSKIPIESGEKMAIELFDFISSILKP